MHCAPGRHALASASREDADNNSRMSIDAINTQQIHARHTVASECTRMVGRPGIGQTNRSKKE
eukprot:15452634-Alexandrium_andersonii.AAC.1